MLVPAAHTLQLLVSDPAMERQLRKQCQEFVKRSVAKSPALISESLEEINADLPITDLGNLATQSVSGLQPRLLSHLCLGYLKLAEYDQSIRDKLVALSSNSLGQVVEEWIKGVQPPEIESTRILVQFMCKLRI